MKASPIARIEDAIMRRLGEAKLPYLRTVATYGGELDGEMAQTIRRLPAVWVAFQGEREAEPVGTSRTVWHVPATWVVLVAAHNLRNEAATRRGDAMHVGTYQMLEDVRALLLGQDFEAWGLEMDPLRPGRVRSLFNGKLQSQGVSIYAQEWHTRYALHLPPTALGGVAAETAPGTVLPPLSGVGLRYHLQPDDGTPDAVDLVTLQQGRM